MGLAGFNLRRKRAEQKRQEGYTDATAEQNGYDHGDDLGMTARKLNMMNKNDLKEYAQTIGLHLGLEMTKIQMIELIQQRETEMA